MVDSNVNHCYYALNNEECNMELSVNNIKELLATNDRAIGAYCLEMIYRIK